MANKRFNQITRVVTSFDSNDVLPVGNITLGDGKMTGDKLLELTAQNALAGNVAQAFVPNSTTTVVGMPYVYNGTLYVAKEAYQGPWDATKFENKDVGQFLERLAESTSNCTVSLSGANMNTVYHDFLFTPFNRLVIDVSNPNWAVTSLVENANKLLIQAVLSNGTTTNIAQYNRDNTVPSTITLFGDSFRRLGDVVGWRFFFRADVGQKVDFSIRYDCGQYFYAPMRQSFEMGNVTISSSSMTYSSSTTRMRTKKGEVYDFNAGDIIYCKSGYEFFLSLSSTGSAPYSPIGWITSYYFTTDTKCCCILVRKSGEAATTFNDLFNSVIIHSDNCQLKPNNVEMFKDGAYDNSVLYGSVGNTLAGANMNAVVQKYRCNPGVQLKLVLSKTDWAVTSLVENANKFCIRWINSSGTASNLIAIGRDGWTSGVFIVTVPEGAVAVDVFFRGDLGESVSYTITDVSELTARKQPFANLTKAINHRGYNLEAPENTLPAFRLSEKKGFSFVETDVHACADGTLVCIHDSTVDRTSDGTGNVADMTIEELKALDFGSWFSAKYTGTKIPTLEEFLATCRDLGLKAYLEIKDLSNSSVENLVNLVNAYGMGSAVTYISFGLNYLQGVVAIDKKARVGLLTGILDATAIGYAETLITDENEVFIDAGVSAVNPTSISIAKAAGIPVEIWTAYGNDVLNADPYVSGFTSDSILASDWLYLKEYYKLS